MSKIHLQLVTPERTVLHEELDSLSCPTSLGQITVLPNHIPLVATLKPGELVARAEGKEHNIAVAGGFVEIRGNNQVVILADAAEHHHEIDIKKAEEAVQRARSEAKKLHGRDQDYAKVMAVLNQNLVRVNVARKHAHRRGPSTAGGTLQQ